MLGGSGFPDACNAFKSPPYNLNVISCIIKNVYSDPINSGLATQNAAAINKTVLSVANYVQGAPPNPAPPPEPTQCSDGVDNDGDSLVDTADPDCTGPEDTDETGPPPIPQPPGCSPTAYPPVNVSAEPLGICHPPTDGSFYDIKWNDACPGTHYLVDGFQVGTGTTTLGPVFDFSLRVIVSGSPAAVTVRSCDGFACSVQSFPPVTIFDTC